MFLDPCLHYVNFADRDTKPKIMPPDWIANNIDAFVESINDVHLQEDSAQNIYDY